MLDQLMNLVRQEAPKTLSTTGNVPVEQQGAIQEEAAHSVFSGMQQIMQTQGPAGLQNLFAAAEHGDANNPQLQMLTNNFAGSLGQKFGLGGGMAKTIAMALIPMIVSRLFRRTKDPNDNSFNIQDILGSLVGGGAEGGLGGMLGGGLGSMLGGAMGGGSQGRGSGGISGGAFDKDGDGDTDLKDLMGMFR